MWTPHKPIRLFISTGLCVALLLASGACGKGSTDSASSGAEASTDSGQTQAADAAQDATGEPVTITIESWRSDDQAIWDEQIIPAFEASHPDINVEFNPTPPTEYDAALATRLEGGIAGDLIVCRPFDASLDLYTNGQLASLSDLDGIDNFSPVAQSAWITDDGTTPYCVPMASVIHGFMYNKDIFEELDLTVPTTETEFYDTLDAIKADGTYTPMAMGTADQWEAATMGFQNIGPNYWQGEQGRTALISGDAKFTDEPYVKTFESLAAWGPYLPEGYEAVTYTDSQNLFTLGQAAIYPTGSWEIAGFNDNADFEFGAFPPPTPDGQTTCYISDHTDIGIGMNAATPHPEAARTFLTWVASPEFADVYANAVPGFFSLQTEPVDLDDPVAQEFVSWRDRCESTIRNSYQILSRGEPNLEDELWATSVGVINGDMAPSDATSRIQEGLDTWHQP